MNSITKRTTMALTAAAIALAAAPLCSAQTDHVVPMPEIQQKVNEAAQAREQNLQTVQKFLSSPQAQRVLKKGKVDYRKVETAIPTLNDQELARLAARARTAQADFAAGALSNEQLTYIIIALATAVIVILVVEA